MKKRLLALLCSLAMLLSCFAVMASAATTKTIKTNIPKSFPVYKQDATFTTVNFWHAMAGRYAPLVDNIANWYNSTAGKKNKIYVKTIFQGAYADITIKLQATLQSGRVKDLPDLCQLAIDGAFSVSKSPNILYMQDMINSDKTFTIMDKLNKGAMWACSYKGKQLGLPFSNSIMAFHYNIDAFKAVGLDPDNTPKTVAELATIVPKLVIKSSGKKPVRYGISNKIYAYHISNWIPPQKNGTAFQFNNEEGRQGAPTQLSCASDGTLKATLVEWKKVLDLGSGIVDWNTAAPRANFENGITACYMDSCVQYDTIETFFAGAKDKSKRFDHGLAKIPLINANDAAGTTTSGSAVYMFNKNDEKKKLATWDFVKFLASVDVSAYWTSTSGYFPLNGDAMNTEVIQSILKKVPAKANIYKVRAATSPNSYKFQEPWIPSYTPYSNVISDQVCLMAQGKLTVDQTVAVIAKKAKSLLDVYAQANN